MHVFFLFIILFYLNANSAPIVPTNQESAESIIAHHKYEARSINGFFEEVIRTHTNRFAQLYNSGYHEVCDRNNLLSEAQVNTSNYYSLLILHMLFTAESASDYSRGPILNIPYMWHWTEPNPRHTIRFTNDTSDLKETSPPSRFSKYNSYADIDRTPSLFLTDMLSDAPKYISDESDPFYTFGWCSEREMSFVSLLTLIGYEAKVIAMGAHSWTECLVSMTSEAGARDFVVRVDNTFDNVNWHEVTSGEVEMWRAKQNESSTGRWYDRVAHSEDELERLRGIVVGDAAAMRIEDEVVEFLTEELSK